MTSFDENLFSRVADVRAELGIRRAVDGTGADVGAILDSRSVRDAVSAIDVQAVGDYDTAVADAVRRVIGTDAGQSGAAPAQPSAPAQQTADGSRQWTMEDVNKSSPADLNKAVNDGLLRDLGYAPRRGKRR
jgi:hypothetical protein